MKSQDAAFIKDGSCIETLLLINEISEELEKLLLIILFVITAASSGQKGQFAVNTLTDGPAEKAGVRSADRLIWINGEPASSLSRSMLNRTVRVRLRALDPCASGRVAPPPAHFILLY